jgi:hypothetical protein
MILHDSSETDLRLSAETVACCAKLARFFVAEKIDFDEYASNIIIRMVYVLDRDLPACIDTVPSQILAAYLDYLRSELVPVDFMPDPGSFLVQSDSPILIDRAKLLFRPKYLRLFELVCERASPTGSIE